MIINEVKGNVLMTEEEMTIAHAISGDYTLGAGIAKVINEELDMAKKLHLNFDNSDGSQLGNALYVDNIFNLVVKETYRDTVDEDDLYAALLDMRNQCEEKGIKKIAMPKICCGREKMEWEDVKELIEDAFAETDIVILVYSLGDGNEKLNQDVKIEEEYEDDINGVLGKTYGTKDNMKKDETDIEEDSIDDERRVELYYATFAHLSEVLSEEYFEKLLLEIGFTEDEIREEGFYYHI